MIRVLCWRTANSAQVNPTLRILIYTLLQRIMRLVWYSGCLIKGKLPMVKVLIKKVSWISYYSTFWCYDCNQWRHINCLTLCRAEDYFNLSVNQNNFFFLYVAKWQNLLFQGHGVITEYITKRSGAEDWGTASSSLLWAAWSLLLLACSGRCVECRYFFGVLLFM